MKDSEYSTPYVAIQQTFLVWWNRIFTFLQQKRFLLTSFTSKFHKSIEKNLLIFKVSYIICFIIVTLNGQISIQSTTYRHDKEYDVSKLRQTTNSKRIAPECKCSLWDWVIYSVNMNSFLSCLILKGVFSYHMQLSKIILCHFVCKRFFVPFFLRIP